MSNEIFFRDYRTTDLDVMFRLDEDCFEAPFRFDRESMRAFAEEKDAIVRVAEKVDGEMVGFVIVHVERTAMGQGAYVVTLDVAAECRQLGLGRQLMREAEVCAAGVGARWMQLHVFTGNAGAIRFYERLGYRQVRVERRFYGKAGLDAFVYGKELPGL
jgi:ribosomal-protein-alanine N-acetyltransferase